jgi:peptidoglycan/xylan/chitin deacetylase (PgdA/CDA1 family)
MMSARWRVVAPVALLLLVASTTAHACDAHALGTARTLTLKPAADAWGGAQHAPLPTLQPGEVVLTFDDGPSPSTTPQVLDALAVQCVQATFFLSGSALKAAPELGRRLEALGHSVAMHGFEHPHFGNLSEAAQLADLRAMQDVFTQTFGHSAPAFRFPFLEETPTLMAAFKAQRITVMSIDLAIDDWLVDQTPDLLVARLLERLRQKGGGIILMHDPQAVTAAALPALLKALKDNGYRAVHLRWE